MSPEQRLAIEDNYQPIRDHAGFGNIKAKLRDAAETPSKLGRKPRPKAAEGAAA